MNDSLTDSWKLLHLKELCNDFVMGQSPPGESYNTKEIGYPLLNGAADLTKNSIIINQYTSKPTRIAKKGYLIFCIRATIGNIHETHRDYCLGRGVAGIEINSDEADKQFISYLIDTRFEYIKKISAGSVIKGIKKEELENLSLFLPKSVKEQKKIASILENVDNNIDKTQEIIEKYDMVKQGLIYDLFCKERDKWIIRSLNEISQKKNQGVNTTTDKVEYSEAGIPVIRAKNIFPKEIDFKDITFVNNETFARIKNDYKPKPGDILYTNIGSDFGNAAKVKEKEDFIIAWNVLRLQLDQSIIHPDYFCYILNSSQHKKRIKNYNSSTTVPFISGKEIGNIKFPVPSIEEQKKIASILDNVDNKIISEKKYLSKLQKIKTGLMQDLLTGKVRVKT